MRSIKILIWMAPVFLMGCFGLSKTNGAPVEPTPLPIPAIPAEAKQTCAKPETLVSLGGTKRDDAKSITSLGNALLDCEARRVLGVRSAEERGAVIRAANDG